MKPMTPFHRLSAALFGLALWLLSFPAAAATTTITFLLVNDIYEMSAQRLADGRDRGGFARLAAVVKAERASGRHMVFAHGGDTLSPSLMSGLDQGAHIIELTNMVRPDVFVPGNHEFDFGKAVFFKRMAEAAFPIYAANLRGPDGAPLPNIRNRGILTFDGVRIGVTGAVYDETPRISSPQDLGFLPTVARAVAEADALRREGADFVLVVTHADRPQTLDMMTTRKIDLVLSGHNHDLYLNFDGRNGIVESSYDAHYLVAVDVTIDVSERHGRRTAVWWPQFRVIDTANVTPDAEVAAVVARYEAEMAQQMDVPIATTAVTLDSRNATVRTGEAAIGNLIADAMRAMAHADAAVMNGGGIRAGRVYAAGSQITRRDVLAELPFGNRLVTIEITGRDLRAGLENGLAYLSEARGRFPQVSGITLTADLARPGGQRIQSIAVDGVPLDPGKVYKVATNDFLARGSDGYVTFGQARPLLPVDDSPLLANEVMVYLRRLGTVRTGVEGRITLR
jgi:2',3'-cyclic-nucleotide 2'-phosphodiesterase (5'-nucleotidase family)